MGYFDRHEQPGYWADITRHFAPDAAMLDVGCGSGWLSTHFPDYTGVDGSPEAVGAARELGRNVVLGDVQAGLAFPDASFDGVVMKDLLEHVGDPLAVVQEACRVLRPGGRVFASSPDAQRWMWNDYTHRRPYTLHSFRLLFGDAGFHVERVWFESVAPGTSIVSARTRRHRRPRILAALVLLPFWWRNVWIVASRP